MAGRQPLLAFSIHAALALCWFVLSSAALAQESRPMFFQRFDRDSGLSQLAVNTIAQDQTGFLWVGTEDGLDQYDGYRFARASDDNSAESPTNDYVAALARDREGGMWLVAESGSIHKQNLANGAFEAVLTPRTAGTVRLAHAWTAQFDRKGYLWVATRDAGLIRFDPSTGAVSAYRQGPGYDEHARSIFALLEDRASRFWVGSAAGLDRLDVTTGKFIAQPLPFTHPTTVTALLEDDAGQLWVGTTAGLVRLDLLAGTSRLYAHDASKPDSLPSDHVTTLLKDSDGRIWIGTEHGLALLRAGGETFSVYTRDDTDRGSLPDDNILSLFQDRSGLLWVGTKFGGLAKWNPRSWRLGHQPASPKDGFGDRKIMAFTEDRAGRLWIATFDGGITIRDRARGTTHVLKSGLSDERVMALLTDRNGFIWAGTMSGGLDRIDPTTFAVQVFTHDPENPGSLRVPGVMSLFEDSQGQLWVGTYGGGLSRFNPTSGTFDHFIADPKDPTRLASNRVTAMGEGPLGFLWVGTDGGGLHLLDAKTGRFTRFRHDATNPRSLSSDTLYAFHTDARGRMWIGTRAGGLERIEGDPRKPSTIHFVHLRQRDGLPNDTVYGIRSDASGSLWLSTNYGLARVNPESGDIRAFHLAEGLQDEEFNFGAHFVSSRGEMFFGGNNGYNAFFPGEIDRGRPAPAVVLTSVRWPQGTVTSGVSANHLRQLHLGHGHDEVTLEFAALDFEAPRATQFAYLLESYARDWNAAGTRRTVSFSDLPGGRYTLRVRARTRDGIWSPSDLAIALTVDPSPWRTPWAYAAYVALVLLLAGGVWLMMRRRLRRAEQERARLEALVEARTRELAAHANALEKANRHLEEASSTDALTGLGNRRALELAIPRLIASLPKGSRLALMVADMDRLKPINDEFGHEAGDRVIMGVGSLLRSRLREGDKIARWGGDEFVLAHVCKDAAEAAALAERMRQTISKHRFALADGAIGRTSCSFGFALYPFVPDAPELVSWQDVLRLADCSMYLAKKRRNAWVGFEGGVAARAADPTPRILADAPGAEIAGLVKIFGSAPTTNETIELILRKPGGTR